MLANVLKSQQAIQMSIRIIEIFIQLREFILSNKDVLLKIEQLESKSTKNDADIQLIFKYLKQLLSPPKVPRKKIGYTLPGDNS